MTRRAAPLKRTKNTYEFFVRFPHGTLAMKGLRQAARHFGFHTFKDPTTVGTGTLRLLIHKNPKALRAAAKVLDRAYSSDRQRLIDKAEAWLNSESGVNWFDHDARYWNIEQDEGALENLGWKRTVVEIGDYYRITLRLIANRRDRIPISRFGARLS
jgi:hypothetical protein